ncbi:FHA domain-containing protein [Chlamydiia bacterium]|nr:FHA domain-containing protein [Chlamydiia bacterium]
MTAQLHWNENDAKKQIELDDNGPWLLTTASGTLQLTDKNNAQFVITKSKTSHHYHVKATRKKNSDKAKMPIKIDDVDLKKETSITNKAVLSVGSFQIVFHDIDTEQEEARDRLLQDFESMFSTNQYPSNPSKWFLKVVNGSNEGGQFDLKPQQTYTIGSRASDCDILISESSVSRKHLSVTVLPNGNVDIVDLNSKNGSKVNHKLLDERTSINSTTVISLGSTDLMLVNREREQKTVMVTKDEIDDMPLDASNQIAKRIKMGISLCSVLLICFIYVMFNADEEEAFNITIIQDEVSRVVKRYPGVKFRLAVDNRAVNLSGHVMQDSVRVDLINDLQSSVSNVANIEDNGLIIDELVVSEQNRQLSRRFPASFIEVVSPGEYTLRGHVNSVTEQSELIQHLNKNFTYVFNLDTSKLLNYETLVSDVNNNLQSISPNTLFAEMENNQLVIVGSVPPKRKARFDAYVNMISNTPGITVNTLTTPGSDDVIGYIDITENYVVNGSLSDNKGNMKIMINNRVYARGDVLNGMVIESISGTRVLLNKDGVMYQIRI